MLRASLADSLAARGAAFALIAFVAVGAVILDDYGVSWDEQWFRIIGRAVVDYVLGDGELRTDHNRYYGVALEAPLILLERLLIDSRAIYLSRHVASHLFFLTGGFFCWLLARRLFGDRRLALFALLLFLLHPRLYAHSFFNSRDIPFLALFMVALYLLQRAFRRDTAGAFALCGLSVGLLVSLRIMGVMLFAAVGGAAGARPAAGARAGGAAARAGHRRRVRAGRRGHPVRGLPLSLARPVGHRRRGRHAGPASVPHHHPLSGRTGPLAVDTAPLPAHLDGDHHPAGHAAAVPDRSRGRDRSRRRASPVT